MPTLKRNPVSQEGDSTPAEQFVMDLVADCDGLTPDDAMKILDGGNADGDSFFPDDLPLVGTS